MPSERELRKLSAEIEGLVTVVQSIADDDERATVMALIRKLMQLHGAGLERMSEILGTTEDGRRILEERLAKDELVSALLLLHGVHPEGFEMRVKKAFQKLHAAGGMGRHAELVDVQERVVRVRIEGARGCASETEARALVENTIRDCAPDAERVEVVFSSSSVHESLSSTLVQLQTDSVLLKQA